MKIYNSNIESYIKYYEFESFSDINDDDLEDDLEDEEEIEDL